MKRYYMINKPAGCITARKDRQHPVVMEYFKDIDCEHLNPVGRLDIDTEGLLFVTDDGVWNNGLMSPDNHVKKEYFFWVLGELNEERVALLENGVMIKGSEQITKPARVTISNYSTLYQIPEYARGKRYKMLGRNKSDQVISSGSITITEGKKRQIKRMMKAVGCYIVYLKRYKIGDVWLDDKLMPGDYRALTDDEIRILSRS